MSLVTREKIAGRANKCQIKQCYFSESASQQFPLELKFAHDLVIIFSPFEFTIARFVRETTYYCQTARFARKTVITIEIVMKKFHRGSLLWVFRIIEIRGGTFSHSSKVLNVFRATRANVNSEGASSVNISLTVKNVSRTKRAIVNSNGLTIITVL